MRRFQTRQVVSCAIFACFMPQVGGAATPATGPTPELNDFGLRVEQLLGVRNTRADVLPLLTKAIKVLDGDPAVAGAAQARLVDGLMAGPDPSVLLEKNIPLIQIGSSRAAVESQPNWNWGYEAQRDRLIGELWGTALAIRLKDPEKAKRVACASLLLAALDDFDFGWSGLYKVTESPEKAKSVLALPDGKFEELQKLVEERDSLCDARWAELEKAYRLIDAISASKDGEIGAEDANEVILHLDKAYKVGPPQRGYQWDVISHTWSFRNLVKARGTQQELESISALLRSWDKSTNDTDVSRWVSQALSRDGPLPSRMLVDVELQPDGTLKPLDSGDSKAKVPK